MMRSLAGTRKRLEEVVKLVSAPELKPLSPVSFSTMVDFPEPASPSRMTHFVVSPAKLKDQ